MFAIIKLMTFTGAELWININSITMIRRNNLTESGIPGAQSKIYDDSDEPFYCQESVETILEKIKEVI